MNKGTDTQMLSDAEQVAALIDGTLPEDRRRALLARLADDPQWRDVLMMVSDVGEQPLHGLTPRVVRESAARDRATRGHVMRWRWTMAAAAAMVGVVGLSYWTHTQMSAAKPPVLALALVDPSLMSDPSGVADVSPAITRWTRVRAAQQVLPTQALSVRLGALSAAALQASQGRDEGRLGLYREDMHALMQQLPGSSPLVGALDAAKDAPALFEVLQNLRALVDGDAFDVGVMLALSHARGDIASDRLTTLLTRDSANDTEVARLLTRLHDVGAINAPAPSAVTVATLDSLLVRLGR